MKNHLHNEGRSRDFGVIKKSSMNQRGEKSKESTEESAEFEREKAADTCNLIRM